MTKRMIQSAVLMAMMFGAGAAHAACAGCDAVHEITAKLETMGPKDDHDPFIDRSSKAIVSMAHGAGLKLAPDQIHEAVLLLAQIEKYDDDEIVVESVMDVIKANQKGFDAEIKKLPKADRELVSSCIQAVREENENGNG